MNKVHIIGMGLSRKDLTQAHLDLIREATLLVGGTRLLDMFPEYSGERMAITNNIPDVVDLIRSQMDQKQIVVLASGDPLFHGIGSTLARCIPLKHLAIHPNITSIAAAFSAVGIPWHDAKLISLHSKGGNAFDFRSLSTTPKAAFLTSPTHGPGYIADQLVSWGISSFNLCVLEHLGDSDRQRISWHDNAVDLQNQTFSNPNIVIFLNKEARSRKGFQTNVSHETHLGMPEASFRHENGLITKSEIRAVTISKLRLMRPDHVLWDIGSGSGSIAVESAAFIQAGKVFAVEKNVERITDIKENTHRFNCHNVIVHQMNFPDGHEILDQPDRIFIGGGGKDLGKIIEHCCDRLTHSGVIVVNTVVMETMEIARDTLNQKGFSPELIQVQVSRSSRMPGGSRLVPLNPVWIISGMKPSKEQGR